MASERDPLIAAEVPVFVAEIQRIFTAAELRDYLDRLERSKYLAPPEQDLEIDDPDDGIDDEPWPENPVMALKSSFDSPVCGTFFSRSPRSKLNSRGVCRLAECSHFQS